MSEYGTKLRQCIKDIKKLKTVIIGQTSEMNR